jgi:hypothetical protein
MTRFQKWFAISIFAVLLCLGAAGQLQQSGGAGSSVAVSNFPATQPVSVASMPSTPVTGTFWQSTQPVSLSSLPALPAGTNVIGVVQTIPKTACTNNTVESQALAAVPTVATAVFSVTTCLTTVLFNNTNSSSVTVTLTDNQGTPVNDVLTFSIPANSQLIQPLGGIAFTSGVKWTASTTGVTGGMLGYN